jgi:hypothetical protein
LLHHYNETLGDPFFETFSIPERGFDKGTLERNMDVTRS